MSMVNGYVCTSSCDVAKAKRGEDPHPALGSDGGVADTGQKRPSDASNADNPAVIFDGALSALTGVTQLASVAPAADALTSDPATARRPGSAVDLLA
jgi:hypothetical protein